MPQRYMEKTAALSERDLDMPIVLANVRVQG
jgi:hypothetical protein